MDYKKLSKIADKQQEPIADRSYVSYDEYPMSAERRQQMQKYHELSDEEFEPICENWTKRDWLDYHLCFGTISSEYVHNKLMSYCKCK